MLTRPGTVQHDLLLWTQLQLVDVPIQAALGHQLLVRPLFDNVAILQHQKADIAAEGAVATR